MTDTTRRGFLAGLGGLFVLAQVPKMEFVGVGEVRPVWQPYDVNAPDGWTYEWARCSLMGEPDPENIEKRIANGWEFVSPDTHPEIAAVAKMTADQALDVGGLILMQKPTVEVEKARAAQSAINCGLTGHRMHKIENDGPETIRECDCGERREVDIAAPDDGEPIERYIDHSKHDHTHITTRAEFDAWLNKGKA
jgi:hypothetical protein